MSSVLRRTSQRLTPRYSLPDCNTCYAHTYTQIFNGLVIEGQSYLSDSSVKGSVILFDTLTHLIAAVTAIETSASTVNPSGPYLFTDLGHSITVGVAGGMTGGQNYITYRSVSFSNGPYTNGITAFGTQTTYYVISDSTVDLSLTTSPHCACGIVRAD
jgi:hypothetical protein